MQTTTGTLNPGAHPGSYNGQDAYNDMLVVDSGNDNNQSQRLPYESCDDGVADSLQSTDYKDPPTVTKILRGGQMDSNLKSVVRRLTPLECTRLQGFPDGWVDIGDWTDTKGKLHKEADSPKYKALGNSIALPFWEWLARRICAQYERPVTMGSLFDGIGGFPLAFERAGAKAVWASEIEEFCIAVTKKHFGEE